MTAPALQPRQPRERGILFSAPMVRAILEGRKTVTRRLVKLQPPTTEAVHNLAGIDFSIFTDWHTPGVFRVGGPVWAVRQLLGAEPLWRCPYGQPGDRLLVKESAWMWCERRRNGTTRTGRPKWLYVPMREAPVHYCADHPDRPALNVVSPATGNEWGWRKKLGRFLPAWASRLTLEVKEVRVERLQEISEEDARTEGVERSNDERWPWRDYLGEPPHVHARESFRSLWDSINGERCPWASNPWVWVVSFKKVEG